MAVKFPPICVLCKNYEGFRNCRAFPDGPIPDAVWRQMDPHSQPVGSEARTFEKRDDVPDELVESWRKTALYLTKKDIVSRMKRELQESGEWNDEVAADWPTSEELGLDAEVMTVLDQLPLGWPNPWGPSSDS